MKHKILSLLVLLLTAATGAWAEETPLVTINASSDFTSGSKTFDDKVNIIIEQGENIAYDASKGWFRNGSPVSMTIEPVDGVTISKVKLYFSQATPYEITSPYIVKLMSNEVWNRPLNSKLGEKGITKIEVYGPAEAPLTVEWNASTKTGTFEMPAYDVEIAPIYAPAAKWATDGDAVLAPTAIEGIFAGTTDAIVKAGTVAKTGDNVQGTAMYFATTDAEMTAEKAAKADGWLSTLPTAAGYDGAQTVYVWYYIKGADTPQGQEATAENTFNDSEICATPLKVEVLSNKFDIALKAANANTIEAGKATVKVGDAAATVTDGKIEKVKMGSKVTITAKDGYKFRKAEGKKGIVKLLTIGEVTLDITGCTTWQDVIFKNYTKIESSVGCVWTKGGSKILKNASGNVSTDAVVNPNATDYYWASTD